MLTVNIHEAKTHLSRLVDRAVKGEPFVIAKAGKPLVKVVPLETPEAGQVRRLGFMAGQIAVPDGTAPASRPHNGYDGRSPCEWQPVNAVAIRDDKLPAFAGADRAGPGSCTPRSPPAAIRNRPPSFA